MSNRFKNSPHPFRNFRPQAWLIIIFVVFFVIASAWKPFSAHSQNPTPTTNPILVSPTPSLDPNEILKNRDQTNGVVAGGVILVLIIVGGTLSVIRQKKET
jgi:hypothetical protein